MICLQFLSLFIERLKNTKGATCRYWPIIDDALRSAVFDRGVELRLLVGLMPHDLTRADEVPRDSLSSPPGPPSPHLVYTC